LFTEGDFDVNNYYLISGNVESIFSFEPKGTGISFITGIPHGFKDKKKNHTIQNELSTRAVSI
jgi:hypothetical protein